MGYLLKEVLKTLCGVNQWSYAVFWKIGCQNPKLLIWEEYYHEPASYSGPQEFAGNDTLENALHKYNALVNDKVHLLVNKMMLNNHVIVVGEGLVGRVAFTGNHQWILSETFYGQTHPPEVQKDVCQQFSDGMQTVAVVPVLPHGVVQFGSFLKIMENIGFVNQVTSLIVHLGYVSGVFQSEDYATKGLAPRIGALSLESRFAVTPCSFDGLNCFGRTSVQQSQTSFPTASGVPNVLQVDGASFQSSSSTSSRRRGNDRDVEIAGEVKVDCFPFMVKADVIPIDSVLWKKQHTGCDVSGSTLDIPSSGAFILNHGDVRFREQEMLLETGSHGPFSIPKFSSGFTPTPTTMFEGHISPGINKHDGAYSQPESGDDLIDVLGADFKNKLISGCWNSSTSHESTAAGMKGLGNSLPAKQIVDGGVLHSTETDHLLDAMVSKVQVSAKSILDCVASCQSTSTNVSSSSASDTSLPYNRLIAVSENSKDELFGVPKYVIKTEAEKSESVSTGYDRKPDETTKTTRKRLRPGENPRPRPKDRQMIQDRVKELREIVPNAAKCSIDSLLERTIKHMIFLQSVTKHADKLNQTGGESKIISKDGGFLLKDNLAGGATWAYEVGSQSMVCPIIVEDLHQPRQMLVEMLCEERGWFLEIADVIRGLGLTILKGIMETRNDKIWARFAVEANRDITRMEIFISLVHILEQGATTGVTQPNDIGSKNIVAKQLQPVASFPSCGKSYCLH